MVGLIIQITLTLAIGAWTINKLWDMPKEIIQAWREINEFHNKPRNESSYIRIRTQEGNV